MANTGNKVTIDGKFDSGITQASVFVTSSNCTYRFHMQDVLHLCFAKCTLLEIEPNTFHENVISENTSTKRLRAAKSSLNFRYY